MKEKIKVSEIQKTPESWSFLVMVDEGDKTSHEVNLKKEVWEKLKGNRGNPEELIADSFTFLLEREPKEAILQKFDLEIIGKYFPEYEKEISG